MLQVSLNFTFSHFLRLFSGFFVLFASFFSADTSWGFLYTSKTLFSWFHVGGELYQQQLLFQVFVGVDFRFGNVGSLLDGMYWRDIKEEESFATIFGPIEDMSFSLLSITKKLCFLIFVY